MKNIDNDFYSAPPEHVSLQKLLDDDCLRRADGLLCQETENYINKNGGFMEEKELIVFFLDIRNFTCLLQEGNEYQAVNLLNKLFDLFGRVITGFGGRLLERSGDSLYAVFGLQTDISNAANAAHESAIMLFDLLSHVNREHYNVRFGKDLQVGVGIHAGRVIVNHSDQGSGLLAMGLAVNLAARLQLETKIADNDLILSDDFYRLLAPEKLNDSWERLDQVQFKGIDQPQNIWLAGKPYSGVPRKKNGSDDFLYWLSIAG